MSKNRYLTVGIKAPNHKRYLRSDEFKKKVSETLKKRAATPEGKAHLIAASKKSSWRSGIQFGSLSPDFVRN